MQSCQPGPDVLVPTTVSSPEDGSICVAPGPQFYTVSDYSLPTFGSGSVPVEDDVNSANGGTGSVSTNSLATSLGNAPTTFEWNWNESLNLDPSFYLTDSNVMYVDSLTLSGPSPPLANASHPLDLASISSPPRQSQSPRPLPSRKSINSRV